VGYLGAFAVVLGVNLLPAFGPPTWSVLVLFRLRSDLDPVALVVLGATAAATGRLLLGTACHLLRKRLSPRRRANMSAARTLLTANRGRSIVGLLLFALSPIPSAQLFEAAGLMGISLPPLVGIFFLGRLVSYTIYIAGASTVKNTGVGQLIAGSLTSPWGVAVQVTFLAGLVALARIDWTGRLVRRAQRPAQEK
jgi:membrane protein YqaA with SNARE-associated domain